MSILHLGSALKIVTLESFYQGACFIRSDAGFPIRIAVGMTGLGTDGKLMQIRNFFTPG